MIICFCLWLYEKVYLLLINFLLFQFLGSRESKEIQIEKDTRKTLLELEKLIKLNKNTIIEYLIDQVFTIDCTVHENFRLDEF